MAEFGAPINAPVFGQRERREKNKLVIPNLPLVACMHAITNKCIQEGQKFNFLKHGKNESSCKSLAEVL